ncbi:hypothetical protein P872_00115 [Rhodonellum psychrophilum GCM71 = DSM 17998]|uniref:Uncharacterized protein n=1 Tax=Rhodonellum psychrophilum GCM71 = DSM 17998 TaxID=1123057 RepID=U5C131_9BACT|nr:hypothetical protein P872_00115 [Rhodonellum psychrophilum GCM71 = DSM 17998]
MVKPLQPSPLIHSIFAKTEKGGDRLVYGFFELIQCFPSFSKEVFLVESKTNFELWNYFKALFPPNENRRDTHLFVSSHLAIDI